MTAYKGIDYLLKHYQFNTLLDIGSGDGKHSNIFRENGKEVVEIDLGRISYSKNPKSLKADYMQTTFNNPFDAIWVSHVLEHQPNPNSFLQKINSDLKEDGGILAITVPPLKHNIVGGHITLWNAGVLLYQLVLAGFDCSKASIKKYGYNITVIIQRKEKINLPTLKYDSGDINSLKQFFPKELRDKKGNLERFDGNIQELNWETDKWNIY